MSPNNRPKATLKGAVLLAVTTYILASISILEFETAPDSNIKTSADALWWSFTTMITVGCEKYPVTVAGRVTGAVLSSVGVGLTGVYTAYVASFFIGGMSAPSGSDELVM
jgi:voltage-gated potassium channel